MKKKEERLEKQMNEITAENKKLTEPLQKVERKKKKKKKKKRARARKCRN